MNDQPTFLRFPLSIRRKIYRLCSLTRPCPIDFNFEGERQRWIEVARATNPLAIAQCCQYQQLRSQARLTIGFPLSPDLQCFCPPLPHQLLYVCRGVYNEVISLLYGENQFKVSPTKNDLSNHNLEVLWTLNPIIWGLIRALHIGLTESGPSLFAVPTNLPEARMVDGRSARGSKLIREFANLSEHIAGHIPASRMRFSLNCIVNDTKTGTQITEPLQRLPPMLAAAVCLSPTPKDGFLKQLARTSARALTGESKDYQESQKAATSWNDLPKELRLNILSCTDLAVQWSHSHDTFSQTDGFEVEAGKLAPRAFKCCLNCTSTLSTCCCPSVHGAYSTTCTCPALPVALFRTSRLMHAEATLVFYSQNRFILRDDFAATKRFLIGLSPAALHHLRTLDMKISFQQLYNMRVPHSQVARDWADLVATVASLLSIPTLWLSIDAGHMRTDMISLNDDGDHYYAWLRPAYAQLFEPLYQQLKGKGLQKFHVFLCWWLEYETLAEKEVMGSGYQSEAEGKLSWQERNPWFPHSQRLLVKRRPVAFSLGHVDQTDPPPAGTPSF